LEGRLVGLWVDELARHWATLTGKRFQIDLSDVGYVDNHGKALLADLHRKGVELMGGGCLTESLIEEVMGTGSSEEHSDRCAKPNSREDRSKRKEPPP